MKCTGATKMAAIMVIILSLLIISFSTTESHAYTFEWKITNRTGTPVDAQVGGIVPVFGIISWTGSQTILPSGNATFSSNLCLGKIKMFTSTFEGSELVKKEYEVNYGNLSSKCFDVYFNLYSFNRSLDGKIVFKLCNEDETECKDLN